MDNRIKSWFELWFGTFGHYLKQAIKFFSN